ncbi:ligase-associated DNA damage response endonuclease PdeM [Oceaniglobus roseus]|uniref:ligase-associated DNA damage response endonuclease PdeM n=1 Tax=Oceaniglobus roseus TaxID=1737570 RepID=UPI000C7EF2A4|nr:ligase-associated DNA damage response endonuclease PdeM [Kandeliimicrobium roseum]
MDACAFTLSGETLFARASGALWWPAGRLLCVSDLHLGKCERIARRSGNMLPPYETQDTLLRLQSEIEALDPARVVCLGDSFDDLDAAASLPEAERLWLLRLQAGRRWIWIEGNHDPGPVEFGGTHLAELPLPPLTFRHIARKGEAGEVSGHYHPKACLSLRGRMVSRPCFLHDSDRVILPAFGTYTGGLRWDDPALAGLMRREATAVLTGPMAHALPMPRRALT